MRMIRSSVAARFAAGDHRELQPRDLGTLALGRSASVLVLDANPLDDIASTTLRIADVFDEGRRLDRAAMRARQAR